MLGDIQQRGDDSWGLDELDDVGSLDIRDYLQEDELYILDEPKTWLEVLVVTGYSKLQVLEYFGLNYEDPQTEALGHTKE